MKHQMLTYRMLKNHGACYGQLERFKATFGYRCTINESNILKAFDAGLSLHWFINSFMSYTECRRIREDINHLYNLFNGPNRRIWEYVAPDIEEYFDEYGVNY